MSLEQGRAQRFIDFDDGVTHVQLSIHATSSDAAYYNIIFESVAEMKILNADKKASEKDAI